MANTIFSSVGTSMSDATGNPSQSKIVYGTNNHQWYCFALTGTNVLSCAYSSDGTSWNTSGTTLTLAHNHRSKGRNFGFGYLNLASTDVVHMLAGYFITPNRYQTHTRFTLGATGFTVSNAEAQLNTDTNSANDVSSGSTCVFDSNNLPIDTSAYFHATLGYPQAARATNTDSGTSWTAGFGAAATITSAMGSYNTSNCVVPMATGNLSGNVDNASGTAAFNQIYSSLSTASWAGANGVTAGVTQTASNNWSAVARTTSEIHFVILSNNSNTFLHRTTTNGTTFSAGQSIPNLTLAANSGVFLADDGTSVWCAAIDSSNNVKIIKWTASAWDASWTTIDAGGASARSYICGFNAVANNQIGLVWTQANGSNFDIVGTTYFTVAPVPVFPWADWSPTPPIRNRSRTAIAY